MKPGVARYGHMLVPAGCNCRDAIDDGRIGLSSSNDFDQLQIEPD